jgi:lysozyme family protein
MGVFELAIVPALSNEGGYSDSASDNGGRTYRGISEKYNPSWSGWAILNNMNLSYNEIVPSLEPSVYAYYKANYWDSYFNNIADQQVSNTMFDSRINQSGGYGSLVEIALGKRTPGDYAMGVKVVGSDVALINADPANFYINFMAARKAYYESLNQPNNITGWLDRLSKFPSMISAGTSDIISLATSYQWLLFGSVTLILLAIIIGFMSTKEGVKFSGVDINELVG